MAFLNLLPRWQAGPDPIDLPLIIIFDSLNLQTSLKNSYTVTESSRIYFARFSYELSSFLYTPYPGYSTHNILICNFSIILLIKGLVSPISSPFAWKCIIILSEVPFINKQGIKSFLLFYFNSFYVYVNLSSFYYRFHESINNFF